jgi:hypothetical protein
MNKPCLISVAIASAFLGLACRAQAAYSDSERLYFPTLAGFEALKSKSTEQVWATAFIPKGQTEKESGDMWYVGISHPMNGARIDPQFELNFHKNIWSLACSDLISSKMIMGKTNGYSSGVMSMRCPSRNYIFLFKSIAGKDRLYSMHRVFEYNASDDKLSAAAEILDAAVLCDHKSAQHACPNTQGKMEIIPDR